MRRTRRLPPPIIHNELKSAEVESAPDVPELARVPAPSRISIRRRLPLIQLHVNRDWLIGVVILVVIGVGAFLAERGALPRAVGLWWPLLVIALAVIVLIRALGQRNGNALLGSGALFGFGISLLLATAFQVPLGQTWVGVTMIAIGLTIVLRGFG